MKLASKSKNRIAILDMIQDGISSKQISTAFLKNQSEDDINRIAYPKLLDAVSEYVMGKKGFNRSLAREKAKTMIRCNDGFNIKTTNFMGTSNMPNMSLDINGFKVAIEFKKGNRGSSLREGIGQSLIYSTSYDFVIYMFIDTSDDNKIVNGAMSVTEQMFLDNIWDNFNIKFVIV